MSLNAFEVTGTQPSVVEHHVAMEGTGASAPTKLFGAGITITRTSEGVYKLTWSDNPGRFVNMSAMLGASTPTAMKAHDVTYDDYTASGTSYTQEITLTDGSAVDDLEDNEYISLVIRFTQTGVSG